MLPYCNIDFKQIRDENPSVIINEFSSARKKMSTIIKKDGFYRCYAKGAPDFILRGCTNYLSICENF